MWLWNDRTDFGVSLPLTDCSVTKDGTNYNKSVHINYETLYPLPPSNSTFDIYITADKDNGKFTIRTDSTDPDVDLTKNKNIVFYSASGLDHLWMWPLPNDTSAPSVWISSNYVYKFNMAGKTVSCFSYNYGEKFNFYKIWKGSATGTSADFSRGFTFDKNCNYNQLQLANYNDNSQTGTIDISGLFSGTDECTSIYLIENDKNSDKNKKVDKYTSKDAFIKALNELN